MAQSRKMSLYIDERVVDKAGLIRRATGKSISHLVSEYLLDILGRIEKGKPVHDTTTANQLALKNDIIQLAREIEAADPTLSTVKRIEARIRKIKKRRLPLDPDTAELLMKALVEFEELKRQAMGERTEFVRVNRSKLQNILTTVEEVKKLFEEYREMEGFFTDKNKKKALARDIESRLNSAIEEVAELV
ncbi:hypothetical protein Asulf_01319 [Archaeoglobus sulfaticallidus PM70-1]|uniref:Uncharacterized protein n=1 Tax=Archaeoglobus sulfaticallidus PM70-1 TaxID=387631 RepID=N0BM21_9EURY|nr:hypothetical protein [Archaeoglobus sulfaticallidus]AGK61310.1 hypothetical protein Asulf_01319 [Archaeoglobus sulfaticallidus PM70-1]